MRIRNTKPLFHPALPAARLCQWPLLARGEGGGPSTQRGLPQRRAARRGAARRGLHRPLRMGYGRASGVARGEGLGTASAEKLGGPALRLEYSPANRAALGAGKLTSMLISGSPRGSGNASAQLCNRPLSLPNSRHSSIHSSLAVSMCAISPNSMA